MSFSGYNVAATIPSLSLIGRQVADSTNLSGGEDKWAIGNNTEASQDQYRWIYIVDQTILSLTVAGSLAILLTMFILEYKGRPATTRMRLVQSLVLSDLILGIVGTVGTTITLDGGDLSELKGSCDGLGFSLVAVLWTEHMWTMALAVATYMILIYPLHHVTMWLERKWYWLWGFVWVFAIAIALIGHLVFGYFNTGGLCYYGANAGLYGELIQFIPRTIVMLTITFLYLRLYVFLRRPDRIRASFSDTDNGDLYGDSRTSRLGRPGRVISSLWRRRKSSQTAAATSPAPVPVAAAEKMSDDSAEKPPLVASSEKNAPNPPSEPAAIPGTLGMDNENRRANRPGRISLPGVAADERFLAPPEDQLSPRSITDNATSFPFDEPVNPGPAVTPTRGIGRGSIWTSSSRRNVPATPQEELPPWEQIQLPIFHVDGERFGGSSANNNAQAGPSREGSGMWSNWKGLGGRRAGRGSGSSGGQASGAQTAAAGGASPPMPSSASMPPGSTRTSMSPIPKSSARMGSLDAGLEVGLSPSLRGSPIGDVDRTPTQHHSHLHGGPRDRNGSTSTSVSKADPHRKTSAVSFPTTELTPIPSTSSSLDESTGTTRVDTRRPSGAAQWSPGGSRRGSSPDKERRGSNDTSNKLTRKFSLPIEYVPESTPERDSSPKPSQAIPRKGSLSKKRAGDLAMSQIGTKSVRLDDEVQYSADEPGIPRDDGRDTGRNADVDLTGAYVYDADRHRGSEARDEEEDESDGEMDLMRMLQGDAAASGNRRNPEASYEFVEESMASYLNRKTALLMLWFPLGYVLLFSVSLVRIIYDFASRPPIVLRALSRWFVFAQGLLDAIIYGLVEWHTKRVVRKRVRKGTFNTPQTSRGRNSTPRQGEAGSTEGGLGSRALASMRVFSSRGPTTSTNPGNDGDIGLAGSRAQDASHVSSGTARGNAQGSRSRNSLSHSQVGSQTQSHIGSILGPLDRSWDKARSGSRTPIPPFDPTVDPSASGSQSGSTLGTGTPTMHQGYEVPRHASLAMTMSGSERDRNGSGMTYASGAPLLHNLHLGYGSGYRGSVAGSGTCSGSASGTGTDSSRKGSDTSGMEDLENKLALGRQVR